MNMCVQRLKKTVE
ncbi:UNVERIFIED_CONTAM: hypothetical protein GTU68_035230 [Idotea baltica]|nr:hypothetical protein [Idotea baltica]